MQVSTRSPEFSVDCKRILEWNDKYSALESAEHKESDTEYVVAGLCQLSWIKRFKSKREAKEEL